MPELVTDVRTPVLWDRSRPFEVQGHRGARGLRPENTLAGIACALEIGVASIECDVALSIDDAVVLSHDDAVVLSHDDAVVLSHDDAVPSLAEPIPVARLRLAELRRVDLGEAGRPATDAVAVAAFRSEPGQRMATLGGALALLELFAANNVRLDVEIKSARHSDPHWDAAHIVDRVLSEMRAYGAIERCSLRSFDVDVLHEARSRCPLLRRVLLVGTTADRVPAALAVDADIRPAEVVAQAVELEAVAVAPGRSLVTAELVARAHAAGLPVIPWTINDPERVRELLGVGVDGVCTDRPDLVRATLAAQGVQLPRRHRAPAWLGYGWQAWPDHPASSGVA
ncbi:MAG: glycerophosphodiester phosphodiesterase family protein [Dermatophilaceae bacterium]